MPDRLPPGAAPVRFPLHLDLVDDRVMAPLLRGPDSIVSSMRGLRRDLRALAGAAVRRVRRRRSNIQYRV